MLENRWRNNFQAWLCVLPGSCSKLANKSQGDLEPPELLLSTEEAGGNAGDSSEHLRNQGYFCQREARSYLGETKHRASTPPIEHQEESKVGRDLDLEVATMLGELCSPQPV